MSDHHAPISLRRLDQSRNMARFYVLSLQPTLFGEVSLVRHWGRIGTKGRQKIELFDTGWGANAALASLAEKKRKRGYR
ncbi:WGR domain-containing protein [Pseudaminobacter sp. 19-2017]|uniref:WGR domain-containing protein n=1 Tax=Pseudaminobacter soli (ex Zhang et al. 2022) TaxID=2831468 RepID=A0A942IB49_9HYPH|nr:WGR domain-containing protein [Pseudaminobacter soli]MBS3651935.1 WGR domain-containing protein [Pseudaminobacter soli]